MSSSAGSPSGLRPTLLVTLALLMAAAPIATDLYLPAFPEMADEFATTATGVQLSLTAFMIGAGLGQVVFGPLSDRAGRVRPLLIGTGVYVLASAAAAMAGSIPWLVAARLVQGISGAAGMVLARAIVSDLTTGREAARAFSLLMLVGGVAPVVAPLAGSLLAGSIGWRGLLWVVAGIAAISLLAALCVVRETLPPAQRAPRVPGATRADLRRLANRRFLSAALAYAFASGTMLSFISASPFLYQELMGLSQITFGVLFGLNALALSVVGALSARLVRKVAPARLARIGLIINLLAILVMAALVALEAPVIWLTAPLLVAVASLGLVMGNTTALALAHTRGASGLGSAILGLLQFGLAGVLTPLVSLGREASAVPMVVTMLGASVVANLAFEVSRRAPTPSQPAPVRVEA